MRRLTLLGIALAVLVALGGVVWLGPDLALGPARAAASRALGRPVHIAALHVLPAWPPTLVADGVQVEGVGTVARVIASLDGAGLWRGRARVASVHLIRPDLTVVTDASGLVSPRWPTRPPATAAAPARSVGAVPMPDIFVEDARAAWRDPRLDGVVTMRGSGRIVAGAADFTATVDPPSAAATSGLSVLDVVMHADAGGSPRARITGAWRGEPFTVDVTAASAGPLRVVAAMPVRLYLAAGGGTLTVQGKLSDPAGLAVFAGQVRLAMADQARLAPLLGLAALPPGPIDLHGDLTLDRTRLVLRSFVLAAPALALRGDVSATLEAEPELRAQLDVERLDVDALRQWHWRVQSPGPASQPSPTAPPAPSVTDFAGGGRLIPARRLPWGLLPRASGDAQLHVTRLLWGGTEYRDVAADIALHGAVLDAKPLAFSLPGGARVQASLRLDDWADPPSAHITAQAPEISVGALLTALHQPAVADGTGALTLDLRGAGADARALAASLDGTATLHMGAGTIENRLVDLVFAGAGLPLPRLKGQTRLRCLDVDAKALAGMVDFASLVVDTDRLRIDGEGGLNLADESLDFTLHPLWRGGFGFSVPMDVRGTLAHPELGMGGMLAALLPPPSVACPDQPQPPAGPSAAAPRKLPKLKDLLRQLR